MKGVVDRFSEEFVETRRKALDKFLKRVADHPVLSFNDHLNVFLSAKVSAMAQSQLAKVRIYPCKCACVAATVVLCFIWQSCRGISPRRRKVFCIFHRNYLFFAQPPPLFILRTIFGSAFRERVCFQNSKSF